MGKIGTWKTWNISPYVSAKGFRYKGVRYTSTDAPSIYRNKIEIR